MSEKTDKIKKHFRDHKEAYITGGVCLVIGAAVTYLVVKGHADAELDESVKILNRINGDHNTIVTILERRGHPGNMILCNETGEVFASQNRAAELLGLSATSLSRHLRGDNPHAGGFTFTNLGEAV